MAHNSYVRGPTWASNVPVLHGEFELFDIAQFKSINGDDGGTYAPSSLLTIGGAGMNVLLVGNNYQRGNSFNLESSATLSVGAGCTAVFVGTSVTNWSTGAVANFAFDSTLNLEGEVNVTSTGFLEIESGAGLLCAVGSSTSFLGTTNFISAPTFSAGLTASGVFSSGGVSCAGLNVSGGSSLAAVGISGTATCSGSLAINGGATVTTPLTCSAAGRVTERVTYILTTGANSSAYGPENSDLVFVATLTAPVTFTIDDTNAQDGDKMRFVTEDATHFLTINDPIGGTFISLKNATGQVWSCLVMRILGRWKTISEDNV